MPDPAGLPRASAARLYLGIARDGLLSSWLAEVHSTTLAPTNAHVLCAGVAVGLSSLLNVGSLAELLSIGVLSSYIVVCACVLVLRSNDPRAAKRVLACALALSLSLGVCVRVEAPLDASAVLLVLVLATLVPLCKSMDFTTPETYATPLLPFLPWLALCSNAVIMVQLPWPAWVRLGVVTVLVLAYYEIRQRRTSASNADAETVELAAFEASGCCTRTRSTPSHEVDRTDSSGQSMPGRQPSRPSVN